MSIIVKQLAQARLTAALAVVFTASADKPTILKSITITGARLPGDVPTPVSVHIVPAGGQPTVANALFYTLDAPMGGFIDWQGLHAMPLGATLQACGAFTTLTASGAEQGTPA